MKRTQMWLVMMALMPSIAIGQEYKANIEVKNETKSDKTDAPVVLRLSDFK